MVRNVNALMSCIESEVHTNKYMLMADVEME